MLEVVARMPYFAYISMLHLYESLGWWRAGAELRRVGDPYVSDCLWIGSSTRGLDRTLVAVCSEARCTASPGGFMRRIQQQVTTKTCIVVSHTMWLASRTKLIVWLTAIQVFVVTCG